MTLREQLHEAAKEPAGITAVFDLLVREIERLCDEVRKLRDKVQEMENDLNYGAGDD